MVKPLENSKISDEELLNLWFEGDRHAFEAFVKRHQGKVAAYGIKKLVPRNDIEDMVQDVFMRLHRKIHLYEKGRPALPWFFTIVNNICNDWLRKTIQANQRHVTLDDNVDQYSSESLALLFSAKEISDTQREISIQSAYNKLAEKDKIILSLRNENDLSFKEISHKTGKSEVSLRKSYQRIVESLRKTLTGKDSSGKGKK